MTDEEEYSEMIDPEDEPTIMSGKFSLPSAMSLPSVSAVKGGLTYGAAGAISTGTIHASSIRASHIAPSAAAVPRVKKRVADAPSKKPAKILVAFLDEDDNQLWAEKLDPGSITVDYPTMGAPKLTLELDLWVDDEEPT